jgi:predicted nucleic acid-binding Zn finger protein
MDLTEIQHIFRDNVPEECILLKQTLLNKYFIYKAFKCWLDDNCSKPISCYFTTIGKFRKYAGRYALKNKFLIKKDEIVVLFDSKIIELCHYIEYTLKDFDFEAIKEDVFESYELELFEGEFDYTIANFGDVTLSKRRLYIRGGISIRSMFGFSSQTVNVCCHNEHEELWDAPKDLFFTWSRPSAKYIMNYPKQTCSCPSFHYKNISNKGIIIPCKHLEAINELVLNKTIPIADFSKKLVVPYIKEGKRINMIECLPVDSLTEDDLTSGKYSLECWDGLFTAEFDDNYDFMDKHFIVRGLLTSRNKYLVNWSRFHCTCPAFHYCEDCRQNCKHLDMLRYLRRSDFV